MNLNVLNNNRRLIKLVIVLLSLLVVWIPVQRTCVAFSKYITLSRQLQTASGQPTLERPKFTAESFETVDLNKTVFDAISKASKMHQVKIRTMGSPASVSENGYTVLTEEIVLEGDFVHLVRCIDEARNALGLVRTVSLKFERDLSPSAELLLHVTFQMIGKNTEV